MENKTKYRCDGVQFSQFRHSIANVKLFQRHFYILDFRLGMTCASNCKRPTHGHTQTQKRGRAHTCNLADFSKNFLKTTVVE